jgi:4-carboxymuconolactone decarboxylase
MGHRLAGAIASFVMFSAVVIPALAQDRMPPIPADKYTEAQKKAAEEFSGGRGR